MTREIPGFYYDSVKRKYFRIENNRTAPEQAAWSEKNVKRRAVEEREGERKRERLRKEAACRVKRARVRGVPLMGGLLGREVEGRGVGGRGEEGVLTRAWVGGLKEKGVVELFPGNERGDVSAMWVGGSDERSGLGVVHALLNGSYWAASYIPRDGDDRINFGDAAERYPGVAFRPTSYPFPRLRYIRSINFHEPSGRMLLSYERDIRGVGIMCFTPPSRGPTDSGPEWVLPGDATFTEISDFPLPNKHACFIFSTKPAPPSSPLTCIAGLDRGIIQFQNDQLTWLTPPPTRKRRWPSKETSAADAATPWVTDVLSVDFLPTNPSSLILAGTRSSHVCILDTRVPPREWTVTSNTFRHTSSAAHVRAVGDYEVLAAGPRNAMAVYDVRYLSPSNKPQAEKRGGGRGGDGNVARPVLTFPGFRNDAHVFGTGLDVLLPGCRSHPGYGGGSSSVGGIVAAAQDDATVGLFSLRDGSRLTPAGDVDGVKVRKVVGSLMWQTLPGDRHASLFVGEGDVVKKYSFWA